MVMPAKRLGKHFRKDFFLHKLYILNSFPIYIYNCNSHNRTEITVGCMKTSFINLKMLS